MIQITFCLIVFPQHIQMRKSLVYFHLDIWNNAEHVNGGETQPAIGSEGWECSVVIAMLARVPKGEVWNPQYLPEDGIKHGFSHPLLDSLTLLPVRNQGNQGKDNSGSVGVSA